MSNHTTFAVRENADPALSPTPQPIPKSAVLVPTRGAGRADGLGTARALISTACGSAATGPAEAERLVPLARHTRTAGA